VNGVAVNDLPSANRSTAAFHLKETVAGEDEARLLGASASPSARYQFPASASNLSGNTYDGESASCGGSADCG
jgi:hypothetical protein